MENLNRGREHPAAVSAQGLYCGRIPVLEARACCPMQSCLIVACASAGGVGRSPTRTESGTGYSLRSHDEEELQRAVTAAAT